MFRISPDRQPPPPPHEYRDAASQTLPLEGFYKNKNSASGSVRSTSTAGGGTSSTVVRGSRGGGVRNQKAYDYRRMTESLWSPPPLVTSASVTSQPFGCSASAVSVGKDGGHLWNRKAMMVGERGGRQETVTSNEGRTISSVCMIGIILWSIARVPE